MVRKITTIYTLLVFFLIAVLGFLAMGAMDHNTHGICPFSIANISDCPEIGGKIASVVHHKNSLEGLSEAVLSTSIGLVLVFLLFYARIIRVYRLSVFANSSIIGRFIKDYTRIHDDIYIFKSTVFNWLKKIGKLSPKESFIKAYFMVPA